MRDTPTSTISCGQGIATAVVPALIDASAGASPLTTTT